MEHGKETAREPEGEYKHPDPVTDVALDWLLALQQEGRDPALEAAYQAWRARDPRHAEVFDHLAAIWGMEALREAETGEHAARINPGKRLPLRRHIAPPRESSYRSRLRVPFACAAGLFLAVGLVQAPDIILRLRADHISQSGTRMHITLPDGSRMLLDGGTAVALDFAEGRRDVRLLAGEAYFDVVRDPSRLFRVSAAYGTVEVKGTAFAVKSEPGEDIIVLERGNVEVKGPAETGGRVMLEPGRMVRANGVGLSTPRAAEPAALLAWREGRYVFENQPLGRVLATFRRHYRGTIILVGNRLGQVEISGNYRLDDPVGAIRSLAEIAGGTAHVLPGGFIVVK